MTHLYYISICHLLETLKRDTSMQNKSVISMQNKNTVSVKLKLCVLYVHVLYSYNCFHFRYQQTYLLLDNRFTCLFTTLNNSKFTKM